MNFYLLWYNECQISKISENIFLVRLRNPSSLTREEIEKEVEKKEEEEETAEEDEDEGEGGGGGGAVGGGGGGGRIRWGGS